MALNGRKVLAVDWDGTCVEQVWPDFGDWLPGAKEALWVLSQKYTIYIWTTRIVPRAYEDWNKVIPQHEVDKQIAYIRKMLDGANLHNVRIFECYPDNGIGKLSADAYIDDKAIRFTGQWADTVARVAMHCE